MNNFFKKNNVDLTEIRDKIALIKNKINLLPNNVKGDLNLECNIIEDYFKDKYLRSISRSKKVEGKSIGGSCLSSYY